MIIIIFISKNRLKFFLNQMKFPSLAVALIFICFFVLSFSLSINKKAETVNLNNKKTTISKLTKSTTNLNSKQSISLYAGALIDPNWKYEGTEQKKGLLFFN